MAITDLIFFVPIIFGIAMLWVIGLQVSDQITPELNATLNEKGANIINQTSSHILKLDYLFIFLVFGVLLVIALIASQIQVSPIFFVFAIILFLIVLGLSGTFANVYFTFAENQAPDAAEQMPWTLEVFKHLPIIVLIFGAIILILMYGKMRGGY